MPRWGLTTPMLDAAPWGLEKELGLLEPAKVITDPIHGDVFVNRLELIIINSRPFQRLRRVRQLGMTPMVYPGATNTRFSHSLGTLRAAQDLLDIVLDQRIDPHANDDLFAEWEATADRPEDYWAKIGEVVVLARLGALLHDLCHVPFGHSVEDDLGILDAHDANRSRFNHLWLQLTADVSSQASEDQVKALETLAAGRLFRNLVPLILSKELDAKGDRIDPHDVLDYPFVADLVGNTICADLIDYLPRDHLYAGLPVALGHRFMSAFFVTTSDRTRNPERMALSISRDERERTDVITELLKYLRFRYELTERVIVHHAKLAADAMVGKAIEIWFDQLEADAAEEIEVVVGDTSQVEAKSAEVEATEVDSEAGPTGPSQDPLAVEADLDAGVSAKSPNAEHAVDGGAVGVERVAASPAETLETLIDAAGDDAKALASKRLERRILAHGDDGLLEYLRDWSARRLSDDHNPRLEALSGLVNGLLDRDLFRLAGRSSQQQAAADDIYEQHGGAPERRELEEEAAQFAGIDEPWKIAIWLPPPAPRLKSAEVLVFDGSEVVEFYRSEQYTSKRGEDIYEAHKKLWAVSVYMHRSIGPAAMRRALVRLAQRMEVRWDAEVQSLGPQVLSWPDRLAATEVATELKLAPHAVDELLELAGREKVARGPEDVTTFDGLLAAYRQLGKALAEQD